MSRGTHASRRALPLPDSTSYASAAIPTTDRPPEGVADPGTCTSSSSVSCRTTRGGAPEIRATTDTCTRMPADNAKPARAGGEYGDEAKERSTARPPLDRPAIEALIAKHYVGL